MRWWLSIAPHGFRSRIALRPFGPDWRQRPNVHPCFEKLASGIGTALPFQEARSGRNEFPGFGGIARRYDPVGMSGPKAQPRTRSMVITAFAAAVVVLLPTAFWPHLYGQDATAASDASKPADAIGEYSLVTTVFRPSPATHLLNPPITIAVDGGTDRAPGESFGTKTVPAEAAIEDFGMPRYECASTDPKLHGCDALDRTDFTIRDLNTLGYHIVNHGAGVTLSVNLKVHDVVPVAQSTPNTLWHPREIIFVAVPKATSVFRFASEVLVGEWNGEPIVFEVGKPLPESAKKGLEDLGVKQDLGEGILYSFRVKQPEKK